MRRLRLLTQPEGFKACTKCLQSKPFAEFTTNKRAKDGLEWNCRTCANAVASARKKAAYAKSPERQRLAAAKYRAENPEKLAESRAKWRREVDPDKVKAWRKSGKDRRAKDPLKRLQDRIRWQFWASFTGRKGGRRTFEILGYAPEELKAHLERQFQRGMSWDNYGEWHIDHIVPVSSFDGDEVWTAFALTNLRPLWAKENCSKGARRLHLL